MTPEYWTALSIILGTVAALYWIDRRVVFTDPGTKLVVLWSLVALALLWLLALLGPEPFPPVNGRP